MKTKQLKAWIIAAVIAIAPAMICTSCGNNAADEADQLNKELKQDEARIEAERKTRERANDLRLNEIENQKRLDNAQPKFKK